MGVTLTSLVQQYLHLTFTSLNSCYRSVYQNRMNKFLYILGRQANSHSYIKLIGALLSLDTVVDMSAILLIHNNKKFEISFQPVT